MHGIGLHIVTAVTVLLAAGIAIAAPPRSSPTTKTAGAVRTITANLKAFRVQITCFDRDKQDAQRTVDVSVTDEADEVARSAEGLMTARQARRVLDALVADGFFDRATPFGSGPWDPPPQPFYVVQVRTGQEHELIETRRIDDRLLRLLVSVRSALGRGAAGRSADRAIAAIDPHKQLWAPAATQPASRPAAPALPDGASTLHPAYTFRPIDAAWDVEEAFLKPDHGSLVSRVKRDEPADTFPDYFRELEYRDKAANQRVCKTVAFFPSGKIYTELDSYAHGVDLPMGDVYQRTFAEVGKMIAYMHWKDGKSVDGWTLSPEGSRQILTDGHGMLRQPTFDASVYEMTCYYEGLELVSRHFDGGACTHTELKDNTEWGKAAALEIDKAGEEVLWQNGDRWNQSADGKITREALYTNDPPTTTPAELPGQYRQARQKFAGRFIARAQAAGYTLDEMGVSSIVTAPSTQPARAHQ